MVYLIDLVLTIAGKSKRIKAQSKTLYCSEHTKCEIKIMFNIIAVDLKEIDA